MRHWTDEDSDYDRGIITNGNRFGGTAAGVGEEYDSSLPYPATNAWSHIVVTYSKAAGEAVIYYNGDQHETRTIVEDAGSQYNFVGLNAPPEKEGYSFVGCIA